MNILPKKRWHVRTKDNIARVRRDEAEAREKEEKQKEKFQFAESEARINFLRRQSGLPDKVTKETKTEKADPATTASSSNHLDLFSDFKAHVKTTNKQFENEKKEEREKYEKQVGYLTYLGQDTNEALKLKSWYEVAPKRKKETFENAEKDSQIKYCQDPLTLMKALLPEKNLPEIIQPKEKDTINVCEPATPVKTQRENESDKLHLSKKHKKEKKAKKEKKHKKEKRRKHKKDKNDSTKKKTSSRKDLLIEQQKAKRDLIERLRKERLQREAAEKVRQDALLNPKETPVAPTEQKANQTTRIVQKYNSQFNPELAKQNIL